MVALRRPDEGRDRAGLPLEVERAEVRARVLEVAGLLLRIAADQVVVLRVDLHVRVQVVPEVALGQVAAGGVRVGDRALGQPRARVAVHERPLGRERDPRQVGRVGAAGRREGEQRGGVALAAVAERLLRRVGSLVGGGRPDGGQGERESGER